MKRSLGVRHLEYCLGRVPRRGRKVLEARFVNDLSSKEFDVNLDLGEFGLDPSLDHMKSKLPSAPFDLNVESIWRHPLYDPAGLSVSEVELTSPEGEMDVAALTLHRSGAGDKLQ